MNVDCLITGGAGFIGCALISALLEQAVGDPSRPVPPRPIPPRIVVVDNLHPQIHPLQERPAALPLAADLRRFDVCDGQAWAALLREVQPRSIVHLAAETGTGQSLDLPTRHTHTNVTGTACMLEALQAAGIEPEHIVLASSRAVYGEGEWLDPATARRFSPGHRLAADLARGAFAVMAPSGVAATPLPHDHAQTPALPTSVYGATKLAQEHLLAAWCAARSTRLSILRLQNVYGAGQSPFNPYTGIIGLFHRVASAGEQIEVYEDGEIGRDFIAIGDVCTALASALRTLPAHRRTVDVGRGEAMTILAAATIIADLYDAPAPRISGAFRSGDIRWAVARADGLAAELGVRAGMDFVTGNIALSHWLHGIGVIPRAAIVRAPAPVS